MPPEDTHNVRLAALFRDLKHDLQAALKQGEEAMKRNLDWYYIRSKVPTTDNAISLVQRALRAAKNLTSFFLLLAT